MGPTGPKRVRQVFFTYCFVVMSCMGMNRSRVVTLRSVIVAGDQFFKKDVQLGVPLPKSTKKGFPNFLTVWLPRNHHSRRALFHTHYGAWSGNFYFKIFEGAHTQTHSLLL